jgi:hypothetical protein
MTLTGPCRSGCMELIGEHRQAGLVLRLPPVGQVAARYELAVVICMHLRRAFRMFERRPIRRRRPGESSPSHLRATAQQTRLRGSL